MLIARFLLVLGLIVTVNLAAGGMVRPVSAVAVAGEAYALAAGTPPQVIGGSPYVLLPTAGGTATDATPGAGLGLGSGAGNADSLSASVTGNAGDGSVTSEASADFVELFGGVVRVTDLRVAAVASLDGRGASSSVMQATNVLVGGISYTNPRPNTRVELPGIGYVILNEQRTGGDGTTTASAEINAIHLFVTVPSVLGVPAGTEIVVGHAAAGVPDINASRAVPSGPLPTATRVPWAPISTLRPIDISISDNSLANDNGFNLGNDNGNDNGAAAGASPSASPRASASASASATTGTGTPSTGATIVVTVVVVVTTPTPAATPTPGGCAGEACGR